MSDISLSKAVRTNLLSLQSTATMMEKTQERLATGNKVNSALDNPSNFFTASALNSRAADMGNLLDSMASGIKVIEAANNGITALTKNLESMQSTLRQARQDKSFQTDTYEVGKDSTLKLSGGQFADGFEVKLQEPNGGTAASVSFDVAYTDATASGNEGIGARALIEYDASFGSGDKLKINGQEITLGAPATVDATGVAGAISAAMGIAGITGITATASGSKIVLENTDKTAASPSVEFVSGVTAATFGETSFTYDAANVGSVKVGNQDISTGGGTFEAFVKSLQDNGKDGGYTVISDASTKKISLISTTPGGDAPTITGLRENGPAANTPATAATTTLALNPGDVASLVSANDLSIGGTAVLLTGVTSGNGVAAAIQSTFSGSTVTYTSAVTTPATQATTSLTIDSADISGLITADDLSIGGTGVSLTGVTSGNGVAAAIQSTFSGSTVTYNEAVTTAATRSTLTLNLDPADIGDLVTAGDFEIGGVAIDLTGVTTMSELETAIGTAFTGATTSFDGTDELVITFAAVPAGQPAYAASDITGTGVSFVGATAGDAQVSTGTFSITYAADPDGQTAQIAGDIDGTGITFVSATDGDAEVSTGTISITYEADPAGQDAQIAGDIDGTGITFVSATDGDAEGTGGPAVTDGISVTRTNGTDGAFVTTENAASHKFNVTYGDKSAAINIVGQDGSPYAKTNQLDLINDQLKAAGILDVKASFDADDKLVFTANGPESKTLAISGKDVALFGTENVSTGTPAVSAYKSSSTVDRFVEEINRNPGTVGKVRASNDNGKLRIENLSTQALDVEFDKDGSGVGAPTQHAIKGNVIRDNLSKQFNDLRDQLDKFADDASFNGINLLRGDKLTITFNESGSSAIQIQAKDKNGNERPITAANLDLESLIGSDLDDDADIDALLGKLSTALSELRSQASTFGSNLSAVQNRQDFTKSMINTLETGAANLTLADMNEEAANLLALQTRQSLSSSALSMASQQDQSVLQLLR
ncbi:hypothetical protein JHC09_04325 [Devosia sp. MC532]|uniref:flagellin N-terminal helical domain-containing protein n=1 Tax=Devosia sp. MC532 TaxID=2799788 RepID=UPI0018F5F86D|nr:flagellin [Devosia sp. MC532]MBJ7577107.1 hypothetical protein [Devosia sp. MC532]